MDSTSEAKAPGFRRVGHAARSVVKWLLLVFVGYLGLCTTLLILYNWIYPPTTGVQIQRRVESIVDAREYEKQYTPRALSELSPHVIRAVVAAEDGRFFSHSGFDWDAMSEAYEEGGRRGGSTISQQLVKNLFLTTYRSYVRKAIEVPLTILAELILSKERILELYVNVAEWGDGVYGAEMASRTYFGAGADELGRSQAAALAACLPDPRRRRPRLDAPYTSIILRRMDMMGH